MKQIKLRSTLGIFATSLMISSATTISLAQETSTAGVGFELGAGALVAPSYEGASSYEISPYPVINFDYLALDNGFKIGGGDGQGVSFRPSFRYIAKRESAAHTALSGLNDVDASLEIGAGISFVSGSFSAFADTRYGVLGHNGFVGEFGADFTTQLDGPVTIAVGPRVSWASANYMDAYFSVSAAEAVTSGISQFGAGAGFKSIGVEASLRYDVNEAWAVETGLGYNRLLGDAAASPIAKNGSRDQFTGKLGFVRKFNIEF